LLLVYFGAYKELVQFAQSDDVNIGCFWDSV